MDNWRWCVRWSELVNLSCSRLASPCFGQQCCLRGGFDVCRHNALTDTLHHHLVHTKSWHVHTYNSLHPTDLGHMAQPTLHRWHRISCITDETLYMVYKIIYRYISYMLCHALRRRVPHCNAFQFSIDGPLIVWPLSVWFLLVFCARTCNVLISRFSSNRNLCTI